MAGATQQSLLDEHDEAISISALYDRIEVALSRTFPKRASLWVRGEIQSISDRTGHCYMDLVDPDGIRDRQSPVLKVKCWRTNWEPMSARLHKRGVMLEPGMVVVLRGSIDFYKPRAEVSFLLAEVDVDALLGRLAQKRAQLIELLEKEGLLQLNRRLPVPSVPLRVGLVASPGTEGHSDFAGQLVGSPFAFDIVMAAASVQGHQAPSSIAGSLAALSSRNCDMVVVVRGGGSKADLAAFDSELVARAIAGMPVPVWVGIGHTGDQSVADIVANRSFVTPTECGKELVTRVSDWWTEVFDKAQFVVRRTQEVLDDVAQRDASIRGRLSRCALTQLRRHSERLSDRAEVLLRAAPRHLESHSSHLAARASRIGPLCEIGLDHQADRIVGWRRLIAAYDVERQLERGYTITSDENGRLIRSAKSLGPGDALVTRFADGSTRSVVSDSEVHEDGARRDE